MIEKSQKLHIRGVLFDFDGVIVDTEEGRFLTLQKVCKKHGLNLTTKDREDLYGRMTSAYLLRRFPHVSQKERDIIDRERRAYERKHLKQFAHTIPGIEKVLKLFQTKNIPFTIATGTHEDIVRGLVRETGLQRYIPTKQAIVAGLKHSKPHPECYLRGLKILRTKPCETLVIEDAAPGIEAAKKAGCAAYGVCTTTSRIKLYRAGADKVFRNHAELMTFLKTQVR
jgi:beta-phosphoglucomutase